MKEDLSERLNFATSTTIITQTESAIKNFDYIFVILLSMLIVSSVISAFFIRSHPIFFIVTTLLLFIFLIPAAALSNAFEKFAAQEKVATAMTSFTIIDYFMDKLPWILFISFILIMVVLFLYKGPGGDQRFYG